LALDYGDHSSNSTNLVWIYMSSWFPDQSRLAQTQPTTLYGFYSGIKGIRVWSHGLPKEPRLSDTIGDTSFASQW
jgi:hypothetical protein